MVRAHLAAVEGVFGAHALLDEGVSGLGLHGAPAGGGDFVDGVPGQARVVNDGGAGDFLQQRLGEQADDVVALDEAAVFVKKKAAVEIAVPRHAEVRAVLLDGVDGSLAVIGFQRIGDAVGEVGVRIAVDADELQRQMWLQGVDNEARSTVARIYHHAEWLDGAIGNEVEQKAPIARPQIVPRHYWGAAGFGGGAVHGGLQLPQPAVARNGDGAAADQFHAVVVGGIVAGGDHDAAVAAGLLGGKVNFFGPAVADVRDPAAAMVQAQRDGLQQRAAGMADVATQCHADGLKALRVSQPQPIGDGGVQFVRHAPTDIVGLEATRGFARGHFPPSGNGDAALQQCTGPLLWNHAGRAGGCNNGAGGGTRTHTGCPTAF